MKFLKPLFISGVIILTLITAQYVFAAGNIDPISKYSQFLNVDLNSDSVNDRINWNPTNAGATVTDTAVTGTVWGETMGWINLNPTNGGVINTCSGILSGNAWGQNTGWINFKPTNGGVTISPTTGEFSGYAWSQNFGWVNFSCPGGDTCVKTSWRCSTPPGGGGGGGSVDLCLNLPNIQSTVPDGYYKVPSDLTTPGNCYVPPVCPNNNNPICSTFDLCPNIAGNQSALPNGMILQNGQCIVPPVTTDLCINMSGIQNPVPVGYIRDALGYCYPPSTVDVCPNISGIQTTLPSGYTLDTNGNCAPSVNPPIDVCPNLAGNQSSIPTGYTHDSHGNCVKITNSPDVCPNITGNQSSIPNGLMIDVNGNCVTPEPPDYDACPNLPGNQPVGTICTSIPPVDPHNPTVYICSDGIDNDGDGFTDYPNDSGCTSSVDNDEKNPNPENPFSGVTNIFGGTKKSVSPFIYLLTGIGLLSTLPGLIPRIGNLLLSIPFYRRERPFGIVYDAETKEPIDPALVTVYNVDDNDKVVDTKITDINGRYGFLLPKGNYRMTVEKTHYQFPSATLLHQNSDGIYDHLYYGEVFTISDESRSAVVNLNLPMDRLAGDWNQQEKKRTGVTDYFTRNQKLWSRISLAIFILGFIFSAYVLTISPNIWNIVVFALYVVFAIMQLIGHGPVHSGKLTDAFGKPIQHAVVRVWNAHLGNQIAQRITDQYGQYYILVTKGDYYVTIDTKNQNGTYDRVFTSETIHAKGGIINKSFQV
jgi:hypothetical protein